MQKSVIITGCDPAFSNFGMVKVEYDLERCKIIRVIEMELIQTTKSKEKGVKKVDDDWARACHIDDRLTKFVADSDLIVAEIPSGSQSATASRGLGIATGLLIKLDSRLVRVTPTDVKKVVGKRQTSKKEMIEWAVDCFPEAPWLRTKDKNQRIKNDNEHLADALAVIFAGEKKGDFFKIFPSDHPS